MGSWQNIYFDYSWQFIYVDQAVWYWFSKFTFWVRISDVLFKKWSYLGTTNYSSPESQKFPKKEGEEFPNDPVICVWTMFIEHSP